MSTQGSSITALQGKVTSQATTITSLQGTVTSQASAIATLQAVVGADASHGLRKSVAAIAADPVLTLSWLPTYLSLDKNAENGVKGPNIVLQNCNLQIKSTTSESDTSGLRTLSWAGITSPAAPALSLPQRFQQPRLR